MRVLWGAIRFGILLATCLFLFTVAATAQVGNFVSFDVPGASLTRPFDVNNSGVIVGF